MKQDLPADVLAERDQAARREAAAAVARGALRDVGVIALRVAFALALLCGVVVLIASYNGA